MDINKRYKHGELAPDVGKTKNAKLEMNPNEKLNRVIYLQQLTNQEKR